MLVTFGYLNFGKITGSTAETLFDFHNPVNFRGIPEGPAPGRIFPVVTGSFNQNTQAASHETALSLPGNFLLYFQDLLGPSLPDILWNRGRKKGRGRPLLLGVRKHAYPI